GKSVREIVLEIIGRRQIVAAAKNGDVPIVIVETGDLEIAVRAQLALRRDFFVPAALEDRVATAPKQSWERIELVESGSQFASIFPLVGLKRSGRTRLFGKDHGRMPSIGNLE